VAAIGRRALLAVAAGLAARIVAACGGAAPSPPMGRPESPPTPTGAASATEAPPRGPTATPTGEPIATTPAPTAEPTRPAATAAPSPPPAPTATTEPTRPAPTAAAPLSAQPATIEYLHPWEGDHGGARAAAATARRYRELRPEVTLRQTVVTGANYERAQVAAFASGRVPDLTLVFAETLPAYADRGLLQPLDARLSRDGVDPKAYFPVVVEQSSWRGQLFALTHHPDVRTVLYRNLTLLASDGLATDREPASWEELRRWGKTLTRRDGGRPSRLGWVPSWVEGYWSVLLPQANGARMLGDDGRRIAYDAPQTIEALDFVVRATEELAGGPAGLSAFEERQPGPGAETAYANATLALAVGGTWYLDKVVNGTKNPSAQRTAVGALPGGPGAAGRRFAFAGGALNALPLGAGAADAAWEHAAWVAGPEGQRLIQEVSYDLAGHRGAANDPAIVGGHLLRREMLALIAGTTGPAHLPTPAWPLMREEIGRVEQALLTGQLDPSRAAADLQSRLQATLDAHWSGGARPAAAVHRAAPPTVRSSAAAAAAGNLLRNPGFEEGLRRTSLSASVGQGWSPWFRHRGANDPGYWLPEPEYGLVADRPGQLRSGRQAHRWFNSWAIHDAGLYQIAAVPPDAWLRFSIWVLGWSSQGDVFGASEGVHHRWVGIDPLGGTDALDPRIVWSSAEETMDRWVRLEVTAQAAGDRATVFVRSQPEWATKHNDVIVDDAELLVVPAPSDPARASRLAARGPAGAPPPAADRAQDVTRSPARASLPGTPGGSHAYYAFDHPGGEMRRVVNVQASPDDPAALARFGFRVYGPRWDDVYAMSGLRSGAQPNVVGAFPAGERGRYVIDVHNFAPSARVEYTLWLGEGVPPPAVG
jgi:multiple sugar transport system substrate-binding protein